MRRDRDEDGEYLWRGLGFEVLGFAPGFGPEADALHFRMDERPTRITVERGPTTHATADAVFEAMQRTTCRKA
ncbi:hypothetical protein ACFWPH_33815 [Nocardia sp. NPDC058499]|uniref:hypothetical protein n=1 Tax=Nocardia sp. NPDC058499 TaxID=3346530 RepID=UPI003668E9E2